MSLIKLDTINSTNDFLKSLSAKGPLEDFTTVITKFQTQGRGISKTYWHSEPGKNILCSIYFRPKNILAIDQFFITMQTSLILKEFLETFVKQPVYIKWPNDIIINGHKISGVLQENVISGKKVKEVILGIGINVNQTDFASLGYKATSILNLTRTEHNTENLAAKLRDLLKHHFSSPQTDWNKLKKAYERQLLKYQEPHTFKDIKKGIYFNGIIQGVTEFGLLKVKTINETKLFNLKEIQMQY